jgi:hypothetical protein
MGLLYGGRSNAAGFYVSHLSTEVGPPRASWPVAERAEVQQTDALFGNSESASNTLSYAVFRGAAKCKGSDSHWSLSAKNCTNLGGARTTGGKSPCQVDRSNCASVFDAMLLMQQVNKVG